MLYEFKDGLNKYFASSGSDSPVKNLKELIEFNKSDSIELQIFRSGAFLIQAEKKGDLNSP